MQNIKFRILSRKQILSESVHCEKIYNKTILEISRQLNQLHQENLSLRSWEIVIGPWLREYIYFSYKKYKNMKFFLKKKIHKNYPIPEINTSLEFNQSCDNFNFDLMFNSKIIDYFYNQNKLKKKIKIKKKLLEEKKISLKYYIITSLNYFLDIIFKKKFFISHTYLPFYYEKKLEILLGQFPRIYFEPKINFSSYNLKLRNLLIFKKIKKKNIESFIKIYLKYFIPKAYIEDFKKIKSIGLSGLYPKKPSFIFTSNLYRFDESFKIYTAFKINEKIPLIIGQHGHNYFTKIFSNNFTELKVCDYFYSWGYKKKPKIKSLFNFNVINKIHKNSKKNNLLIILSHLKELNFDVNSDLNKKIYDLKKLIKALKNLKENIKKNTIIRLPNYKANRFEINYFSLFKDLNIKIDNGEKKLDKLLEQSKICVFNYDSTGFLENNLTKIPSLILENKNYIKSINNNFIPKYKKLLSNNIMFTDPEKLVTHINNKWENIENWWNNKNIKRSINFFNQNLNVIPNKNFLLVLAKKLEFFKN